MAPRQLRSRIALAASVPAAITLGGLAWLGLPGADASSPTIVRLGAGGIACRQYVALDRIASFSTIPEGHPQDALGEVVTLALMTGECRDLRHQTVALRKRVWNYAQVMAVDGKSYFVLADAIVTPPVAPAAEKSVRSR